MDGKDLSDKLSGGGGGSQQRPPQQPQFTKDEISEFDEETCENCGNTTFTEALQLKIVPSVHPKSPPGNEDAIQPVKTLSCVSCGEPKTMTKAKGR